MLTRQEIKDILLANGFTERQQADGSIDLNPYVYTAIEAIIAKVTEHNTSNNTDDLVAIDTLIY